MKRILLVLTAIVLLLYVGCKSDSNYLKEVLREYEPATQTFKFSADSLITVEGKKGTILKIDPAVLLHQDGSPANGELEIHLLELTSKEDLLRANAQTVSNGRWLISGGAYNIQFFSEGKVLKIADGKSIAVNFPKITFQKMQLFDGIRDKKRNMNWELSNQLLENRKYPVIIRRDTSFMRFNYRYAIDMPVDSCIFNMLKKNYSIDEVKEKYSYLDSIVLKNDTLLGIRFNRIYSETTPSDSLFNNLMLYDASTGKYLESNPTAKLINDVYETITINKLGWINVDGFYPEVTNRIRLKIRTDKEMDYEEIYAADAKNNTLLNIYENEKGIFFFDAPVGQRFTIIAFGVKGEQTFGYKKTVLIEDNSTLNITYRKTNKKKMENYFKLD